MLDRDVHKIFGPTGMEDEQSDLVALQRLVLV